MQALEQIRPLARAGLYRISTFDFRAGRTGQTTPQVGVLTQPPDGINEAVFTVFDEQSGDPILD
jgi:hypothetical protein